jgi:bifunctional phosphoglucose/phosphomannose isomerase
MTIEKMQGYLWELPDQFDEIMRSGVALPHKYRRDYQNIVVAGLGGSAIGGDILRTYGLFKANIPIIVNRDYDMPGFVGRNSLVLAVSYSGNTEETLSAYQQAVAQEAAVIAVTSGGKLAELAERDGCAVITVPGGLSPRAATGYLFTPLALILQDLGIAAGVTADLEETVAVLRAIREEIHPGVALPDNQARIIAGELKDHLPVIWGTSMHTEIAAVRWKDQINENSKAPSYFNFFPELNHNEIVGFDEPVDLLARIVIVMLRDSEDHPRVQKRMEITRSIIQDRVKKVIAIDSRGKSFLARFYSLAYIGDYVSFYLALAYDKNPTPVAVIDYLKAELAKV